MPDLPSDLVAGTPSVDHIPEMAALARDELPSFSYLHDEERWPNKFGRGERLEDNLLIAACDGMDGPLIGFVWADQAMRVDHGIQEPWWCLNAIAVRPEYRGRGIGKLLVGDIVEAVRAVGVELIYGLAISGSEGFWQHNGFHVADEGERVVSTTPVQRDGANSARLTLPPEKGHRWFLGCPTAPRSATLVPESRVSPH